MTETNKKIVFIIEDEDFLVKAYKYIFEGEGFVVWVASDGEEATKFLEKDPPSCILLDIMLPKKDGFELMPLLKANEAWKNVPVIILSNLGKPEDIQKGMGLGAVDYLVKANIDVDHILTMVKRYTSQ